MPASDDFDLILDQMKAPESVNYSDPATDKNVANNLSNMGYETATRMLNDIGPCGWKDLVGASPVHSDFRDESFAFVVSSDAEQVILDVSKVGRDEVNGGGMYVPQLHLVAAKPESCPGT